MPPRNLGGSTTRTVSSIEVTYIRKWWVTVPPGIRICEKNVQVLSKMSRYQLCKGKPATSTVTEPEWLWMSMMDFSHTLSFPGGGNSRTLMLMSSSITSLFKIETLLWSDEQLPFRLGMTCSVLRRLLRRCYQNKKALRQQWHNLPSLSYLPCGQCRHLSSTHWQLLLFYLRSWIYFLSYAIDTFRASVFYSTAAQR
jgi:hypothetical protein